MTALEILGELTPILRRAGLRFWVGGSVASSIWGDPRQTNDVDLIVLRDSINEETLRAYLPEQYYISPNEVHDALSSNQSYSAFQILNMDEAFKFDIFLVNNSDYVQEEAKRVREIEVLPNQMSPLASAEDTIIHKLRWFDLGGRISDRQWTDIVRVLEIQGNRLDNVYLSRWTEFFGIELLLLEAMSQTKRLS